MRVLIAHNRYQQRGGEDAVFENEGVLLENAGHDVHRYLVHNDTISGFAAKTRAFLTTPCSRSSRRAFERVLDDVRPEIVHVHNYFPLITPAIFFACTHRNIPVVHTLHNFRMMCANSFLLRDGAICEKCVTGSPFWAVAHRCYRKSLPGSLALARMISAQRRWGTWQRHVSRFIVLTEFERAKFIDAGIPAEKTCLKPNFVPDPGVHNRTVAELREGALYVGRLSAEKGLRTLVNAWRNMEYPLRIAGDGPLMDELRATAPDNVNLLGRLPSEKVHAEMSRAAVLVMPSNWYEGFPVTLVEALACGLPVAASRIGSLAEVVRDGETGRTFAHNNPQDLTRTISAMLGDGSGLVRMSHAARACYERNYTSEPNLEMLLKIYGEARNSPMPELKDVRTLEAGREGWRGQAAHPSG